MNVLIVKLSSLSDVVYAMPAVQDIRSELPGTQVDWVVEPTLAPLVRRCSGVHRVIECDLSRWRETVFSADTRTAWRAFMADLQFDSYDAVIDLQGESKSLQVARMARLNPNGLRYTLTNQADDSGFEPLLRRVADVSIPVELRLPAAQRSRVMCARALVYALPEARSFGLTVRDSVETGKIKSVAQHFFDSGTTKGPSPVVAFLHGSTAVHKLWPEEHWLELGHRLNDLGYTVAFAHGNDQEYHRSESLAGRLSHAVVWPHMALDAMVDALSGCLGVIGVDSGLCHVAAALDLPLVQIYNVDTAWSTGPHHVDHQNFVYAQPTPSVESVWRAWIQASALASLRD
ncbi:lipopolysaccharide heptosyltransferase I [Variovorax sp. HJSM1_2]|uniref:lipopolysaccharide heptosyltransferase I n=1 Tax=Variovorax sp. HJSM1_2 TaxID=3366263 RepID=UPI003BD498E0